LILSDFVASEGNLLLKPCHKKAPKTQNILLLSR
jgi:hypothetical protein